MIWILRMMLPRPSRRDGWIRGLDLTSAWKLSASLNYQSNVGRVLTRHYHPNARKANHRKPYRGCSEWTLLIVVGS